MSEIFSPSLAWKIHRRRNAMESTSFLLNPADFSNGPETAVSTNNGEIVDVEPKRKKGGRYRGCSRSSVWRYFIYSKEQNRSACKLCSGFVTGKLPGNLQKHLKRHPSVLATIVQELCEKRNASEQLNRAISSKSSTGFDKNNQCSTDANFSNKETKERLVEQIFTKSHLLFGPLSGEMTQQNRCQEWQQIFEYAKTIGHRFPENSDFTYLRDTFWLKLRCLALDKWDKFNNGDGNFRFTKIDKFVLNILRLPLEADEVGISLTQSTGNKSYHSEPPATSLSNVIENGSFNNSIRILPSGEILNNVDGLRMKHVKLETNDECEESACSNLLNNLHNEMVANGVNIDDGLHLNGESSDNENSLKFRDQMNKLLLEQNVLVNRRIRLVNYKLQLEVYEMENKLGLPHNIVE